MKRKFLIKIIAFALVLVSFMNVTAFAVEWAYDTDAGYHLIGDNEFGVRRFLFHADIDEADIVDSGIKFVLSSDITKSSKSITNNEDVTSNTFYGDIVLIPEGAETYYAMAYIETVDGTVYWSEPLPCDEEEVWGTKHVAQYDRDCMETVVLNYSDEFLYRFGTINKIPLDITYYVDGVETEISDGDLTFDIEAVYSTAADYASVTVTNGVPYLSFSTATTGGQIKLNVWATNYPDIVKSITFEILENFKNVGQSNLSGTNACLYEDVTNKTVTVGANSYFYGNGYTIDNTGFTATSANGNLFMLSSGAVADNVIIKGVPVDDVYFGVADQTTWTTVIMYGGATLKNSHVSYGKYGVRSYRGENTIKNVTVYNGMFSIAADANATINLEGTTTIDQYIDGDENALAIGGGLFAYEASGATFNINGDINAHTFVTEESVSKMPSTVRNYVKNAFNKTDFLFTYNGVEYVNPVIISALSSDITVNVSEDSNFFGCIDDGGTNVKTWTYGKDNEAELEALTQKTEYVYMAGFEQVEPTATLNTESSVQLDGDGNGTYDYSEDVRIRKYAVNLEYTTDAEYAGVDNDTKTITFENETEDITSTLTHTAYDEFANKEYTYVTYVSALMGESYTPTIVFASPSGHGTGSTADDDGYFTYIGRRAGTSLDPDFDVDLDVTYGVAAYDYQGNVIDTFTTDTSATGERIVVSVAYTNLSNSVSLATNSDGTLYANSNAGNINTSGVQVAVTVTYKVYDSSGRCTTAKRYYRIEPVTIREIFGRKVYSGLNNVWNSTDQYTFLTRNSFSDIEISRSEEGAFSATYGGEVLDNFVTIGGDEYIAE